MKPLFILAALMLLVTGCHRKPDGSEGEHGHPAEEPGKPDAHGHSHGHGGGDEASSSASFKAGNGITLTEEGKTLLGLEIADVSEILPTNQVSLSIQLFREQHRHAGDTQNHDACYIEGAGWIPTNTAALLKPGLPVFWISGTNSMPGAVVLSVKRSWGSAEAEIVVGISNASPLLKPGAFTPISIVIPGVAMAPAVPASALLRTSEGAFVYAVNGDAYLRTPVSVGVQSGGWVVINDGLLAGDQVVTRPVETLWLIELRATKGGGHSH